jgi:thiol-disulfide isomerase/thioredoxin
MNGLLPVVGACVACVAHVAAFAQPAASLDVGGKAPALTIDTWVKGQPVTAFAPGSVYVVEFWATWCPPCRESIPHLSKLQAAMRPKGVTVIGISSEEEGLGVIRPFVERMGARMDYTVAFDKGNATSAAWMDAAGQSGIPTAFVVDQRGEIAWIGHPMSGLDAVVERVAAGTFDRPAYLRHREIERELEGKFEVMDLDGALPLIDRLVEADAGLFGAYAGAKFEILLTVKGDARAASEYGRAAVRGALKDNAAALNAVAWTIVAGENVPSRDLDLALEAAERAAVLTASKDSNVLDTLARVRFERGDVAGAVAAQTQAVALETDPEMRAEFEGALTRYRESAPGAAGGAPKR